MGLDGVELIMAVEEKFGIEISDDEAQNILTPRMFYEAVGRKIRSVQSNVCLTQRAFYLLRSVLRAEQPIPRKQFRPETSLESLVPSSHRRQEWQQLREAVGAVAWPKLRLPHLLANTSCLVLFVGWISIPVYLYAHFGWNVMIALFASSFLVIVIAYLLFAGIQPLQVSLRGQTVGTLSEFIVAFNPNIVAPPSQEWTAERIRVIVRSVIVEQLGIDSNFSDDARFVEDLGVD